MLDVERVDFVAVPTRDVPRAREFYGQALGLRESTPPDDTKDPDGNSLAIHRRYAAPRPDGMSHAESRELAGAGGRQAP